MTASTERTSPKRRLLLASDRTDHSSELASILQSVGEVETVATAQIPDKPEQLSGVVVDINLRSPESVQIVRNKLRSEAYRQMPRLFVLADALHHGAMQAWARGSGLTGIVGAGNVAAPPPPFAPKAPGHGFRAGQSVFHNKFGEGVIVTLEGSGADARAQINFGRHGAKWLALGIAKLTAVD